MRIDEIEALMRVAESRHDRNAPPDRHLVARLDGRGFHALTRDLDMEKPFDTDLRDAMVGAARHLMETGFEVLYAYTQSDEISLLFRPGDGTFGRKYRKVLSILAGEASASLSLAFQRTTSMDCRLLELDDADAVGDYFVWRQADAERNCLLASVYWALRRSGRRGRAAYRDMWGMSPPEMRATLRDLAGVDYGAVPLWQRHGVGLYRESYEKTGVNPVTGESAVAVRRRIRTDRNLPYGPGHYRMVVDLLRERAFPWRRTRPIP